MRLLFRILFNKYLLVTCAFVVWVGFFDTYDWGSSAARQRELDHTKADIQRLTQESEDMERQTHALTQDPAAMERYAREAYHMKRDTEDVYVVTR